MIGWGACWSPASVIGVSAHLSPDLNLVVTVHLDQGFRRKQAQVCMGQSSRDYNSLVDHTGDQSRILGTCPPQPSLRANPNIAPTQTQDLTQWRVGVSPEIGIGPTQASVDRNVENHRATNGKMF